MVFRLKKRSNHTTTKRNQLLFEQLELRQLMSATPALSPPPLELVATPPLEEAEIAAPLTSNWAPMVYAGGDLTTSLGNDVMLNGETLVNLARSLTVTWSLVSGPGTVVFSEPSDTSTTASFSTAGTYELALTVVNDGITVSDELTITVTSNVPAGLVGSWDFEEGNGSTTADVSGSGHSGIVGGAEWTTTGKVGNALRFDGSNDFVDTGKWDVDSDQLTIATWFKADDFGVSDARLLSKTTGVAEQDHYWMLSTIESNGPKLRFRLKADGTTNTLIAGDGILQAGEWMHAAAVYDGAMMRLYLNGTEVGATPHSGQVSVNANVPVSIGNNPDGTKPFDGLIDQMQVYDRALTPEEIAAIIAQASVSNQAPAVDAGVDSSVVVSAALALDGTVTDDGLPNPAATVMTTWSQLSGPGAVTFGDTSAIDTTASFTQIGTYVLQLAANDGELVASDTVTVTVTETVGSGELLAFPGAEGFGAQSVGGRGGAVIEVTNLNDSGPGSLRAAIDAEGPRIVVFRVSGIIDLNSELRIRNPYITIAGQTAPGGGITLRNASNVYDAIDIGTNDVIIRYISARPGPSGGTSDAIFFGTGASNVIVDHVSASWASDEVMSLWYDANNITIQWSIISEGIGQQHGLFLGGTESYNVSVHHNLIAQNNERNPRIASNGPVDVVNNVIYNPGNSIWGPSHIYYPELSPKVNYVGNYYKVGPNTGTDPNSTYGYLVSAGGPDSGPIQIFVEGNITPLRPVNGSDETTGVVRPSNLGSVVSSRIDTPLVTTTDAFTARDVVLAGAGANKGLDNNGNAFSRRDAVDARVVDDVINASGTIINNPSEVGGWPVLAPGTPVTDTDRDGMPDAWEVFYGFDLNNPSDGPQDADGDGYTNIEEYLNQTLPAANLTAAVGSAPATSDAKALNPESLSPIIEHAISEWAATGLSDKQIEVLNQVQFRVADLQGPLLAQAGPFAITIDTDAAGHGWFIDSTPEFDEEFNRQGNDLIAESGPAAQRMDLLTVVMHELGHVLGRNHEDAIDLMAETLETDVRRGLATDVLDAVFANHLF